MPLAPEEMDAQSEGQTTQRVPQMFVRQVDKLSQKLGVNKREAYERLAQLLEKHDIEEVEEVLRVAERLDKVGSTPGGAGPSTGEMKDMAMMKMWAKVATEGGEGGSRMNMERIMEYMLLKEMFRPPQANMGEMMMMMMQMQMAQNAKTPEGAGAAMTMFQEMRLEMERQRQAHENSMKELLSTLKEKDNERRFDEMSKRQEELFDQSQKNLQEAVEAMGDNFGKMYEEVKTTTTQQLEHAGPKDQLSVVAGALKSIGEINAAALEIGRKHGLSAEQVGLAQQTAEKKTGINDYMNNLSEIFQSAGDFVDKLKGAKGNVPAPDEMAEESTGELKEVAVTRQPVRMVVSDAAKQE